MENPDQIRSEKPSKSRRIRLRRSKKTPPGAAPGAGIGSLGPDAPKPVIRICAYNSEYIDVISTDDASKVKEARSTYHDRILWIEVRGFGDRSFIEAISADFNIHRLEMEDVVSTYQRPKLEESSEHLFIVSRTISSVPSGDHRDDDTTDDQLSVFLGTNFVLTFQERHTDYTAAVYDRLNHNKGVIRKSGPDYLAYAILDTVVDNYFPQLEKLGNFLDDLEDKLLDAPDVNSMQNIQASKRRLIFFRRIMWSEREKLNEMLRMSSPFIHDSTKRYLRDTYDHTIQIMDMIDSYREITASLMDIYLSSVSNKMNNIMKVLTVISTIFIPLTFIVGLYGMNFSYSDPATGKVMPYNMPELYSPYGYIGVCIAMLTIAVVLLLLFYRIGWIDFKRRNR